MATETTTYKYSNKSNRPKIDWAKMAYNDPYFTLGYMAGSTIADNYNRRGEEKMLEEMKGSLTPTDGTDNTTVTPAQQAQALDGISIGNPVNAQGISITPVQGAIPISIGGTTVPQGISIGNTAVPDNATAQALTNAPAPTISIGTDPTQAQANGTLSAGNPAYTQLDPRMQALDQIEAENQMKNLGQNGIGVGPNGFFQNGPADNSAVTSTNNGAGLSAGAVDVPKQAADISPEDVIPSQFQLRQEQELQQVGQAIQQNRNDPAIQQMLDAYKAEGGNPQSLVIAPGANDIMTGYTAVTNQSQQNTQPTATVENAIKLQDTPDKLTEKDVLYKLPTKGLISWGPADIYRRPFVDNPDGTTSTMVTSIFEDDNGYHVIAGVTNDGKVLNTQDAEDRARTTGDNVIATFDNLKDAEAFDNALHPREVQRLKYRNDPQALQQYEYDLLRNDRPELFTADGSRYIGDDPKAVQARKDQIQATQNLAELKAQAMNMAGDEAANNTNSTNGTKKKAVGHIDFNPQEWLTNARIEMLKRGFTDDQIDRNMEILSNMADAYNQKVKDHNTMLDLVPLSKIDPTSPRYLAGLVQLSKDSPEAANLFAKNAVFYPTLWADKQWYKHNDHQFDQKKEMNAINVRNQSMLMKQRAALTEQLARDKMNYAVQQRAKLVQTLMPNAPDEMKMSYILTGRMPTASRSGGGLGGKSKLSLSDQLRQASVAYGDTTMPAGDGEDAKPDKSLRNKLIGVVVNALRSGASPDTVGQYLGSIENHLDWNEIGDIMDAATRQAGSADWSGPPSSGGGDSGSGSGDSGSGDSGGGDGGSGASSNSSFGGYDYEADNPWSNPGVRNRIRMSLEDGGPWDLMLKRGKEKGYTREQMLEAARKFWKKDYPNHMEEFLQALDSATPWSDYDY